VALVSEMRVPDLPLVLDPVGTEILAAVLADPVLLVTHSMAAWPSMPLFLSSTLPFPVALLRVSPGSRPRKQLRPLPVFQWALRLLPRLLQLLLVVLQLLLSAALLPRALTHLRSLRLAASQQQALMHHLLLPTVLELGIAW